MSHCDAVIYSYGVEFCRITTQFLDFGLDDLAYLVEVRVPWNELGEGIYDGYHRFAHLFGLHACCHPQGPCPCHPSPIHRNGASKLILHCLFVSFR